MQLYMERVIKKAIREHETQGGKKVISTNRSMLHMVITNQVINGIGITRTHTVRGGRADRSVSSMILDNTRKRTSRQDRQGGHRVPGTGEGRRSRHREGRRREAIRPKGARPKGAHPGGRARTGGGGDKQGDRQDDGKTKMGSRKLHITQASVIVFSNEFDPLHGILHVD